jgi:hypothetical protein
MSVKHVVGECRASEGSDMYRTRTVFSMGRLTLASSSSLQTSLEIQVKAIGGTLCRYLTSSCSLRPSRDN